MILNIKRIYTDQGTMGELYHDLTPIVRTLEPPWLDNKKSVSCIPEGTYTVLRLYHPIRKIAYQVLDVENRTEILLHPGNIIIDTPQKGRDSEGCILPGLSFTLMFGVLAITRSQIGYAKFLNYIESRKTFELKIEKQFFQPPMDTPEIGKLIDEYNKKETD